MAGLKETFAPLLPPGRHRMSMSVLEHLTVKSFADQGRRSDLFEEVERLHTELAALAMTCELWIDGSFLSEKIHPGDVDICVVVDSDHLNKVAEGNSSMLHIINGRHLFGEVLETFLVPTRPVGHPDYDSEFMHYWGGMWGKGYDDSLKGYAIITMGETDVGLRLSSI